MELLDEITVGKLLVMEYEKIKDEQTARIGFRDNLLYVMLASMATIVAITLTAGDRVETLLLLPPVSMILGWTYLVNDEKISAIGRYIRTELGPRLGSLVDEKSPIFGWETAHRSDRRRVSRKFLQLAVDLTTFCVSPLVAVVVVCVAAGGSALVLVVSIVELGLIVVLAVQMVSYFDRRPSASRAAASEG